MKSFNHVCLTAKDTAEMVGNFYPVKEIQGKCLCSGAGCSTCRWIMAGNETSDVGFYCLKYERGKTQFPWPLSEVIKFLNNGGKLEDWPTWKSDAED